MAKVNVLVIRAAGINCDEEVMHCWRLAGARPTLVHVNALADSPAMLDDFSIVTIPGGFSYGDDIAAGTILAQRFTQELATPLQQFVNRDGGVLGICNGFQVLVKAGLLPGGDAGREQVTVTFNDSAHFEARWVRLEVCTDRCPFLCGTAFEQVPPEKIPAGMGARRDSRTSAQEHAHASVGTPRTASKPYLELPVEHAEGKVVTASDTVLRQLEVHGQIALRYVDAEGRYDRYPANPNGSVGGIAGLCDATGRIFGLMPHPDRHFDHTQHPLWTRRKAEGPADGLTVFLNAVAHWT